MTARPNAQRISSSMHRTAPFDANDLSLGIAELRRDDANPIRRSRRSEPSSQRSGTTMSHRPAKRTIVPAMVPTPPPVRIPETDQQIRQRVERHLSLLQELCAANSAKYNSAPSDNFDLSKLPPQAKAQVVPSASSQCPKEPVTLFHSVRVPAVTLPALLAALCHRRTWCSFTAAEVAVTLFLQYCERTALPCTELMMHRLYVACVLVAAKALQDFVPTNEAVAKASGLETDEVCRLELALLRGLDWCAIPTPDDMATRVARLELDVHAIRRRRHVVPAAKEPWVAFVEDEASSRWLASTSVASNPTLTPPHPPVDAAWAASFGSDSVASIQQSTTAVPPMPMASARATPTTAAVTPPPNGAGAPRLPPIS